MVRLGEGSIIFAEPLLIEPDEPLLVEPDEPLLIEPDEPLLIEPVVVVDAFLSALSQAYAAKAAPRARQWIAESLRAEFMAEMHNHAARENNHSRIFAPACA